MTSVTVCFTRLSKQPCLLQFKMYTMINYCKVGEVQRNRRNYKTTQAFADWGLCCGGG